MKRSPLVRRTRLRSNPATYRAWQQRSNRSPSRTTKAVRELSEVVARREADHLWALAVKERAGYRCQKCGTAGGHTALEAAHIISRRFARLRCDVSNGRALCRFPCHQGPSGVDEGGWDWSEIVPAGELARLRALAADSSWKKPHDWFRVCLAELRERVA